MAEVDALHLVAIRAMAQNAIRAKQAAAFLDVRGRVSMLRKQPDGQSREQREREQSHRHCLSMEIALYVIAPEGAGQCCYATAGARYAVSLI